jgi:hypothetical protein
MCSIFGAKKKVLNEKLEKLTSEHMALQARHKELECSHEMLVESYTRLEIAHEVVVGDSPRGPLKQTGESPLKTHNKLKTNAPRLSTRCMDSATMALTAHQGGPLQDPLEQAPPRSRAHASLGRAPPRSRGCAYLEQASPRSRVRSALERAPPRSRVLRTHAPAPVRGHLMS